MSIVKELRAVGFEKISGSVFALSSGEIVHVITKRKDRHGKVGIALCAWHSQFVDKETDFDPKSARSPIFGFIGPEGLLPSWTWRDADGYATHVAHVAEVYTRCFQSIDDIRRALSGQHCEPFFADALSPTVRPKQVASVRRYGGSRGDKLAVYSLDEALNHCDTFAASFLSALGFKRVKSEASITYVKDRGEIQQCVRLSLDLFGVFAEIQVFPWSRDVWRVERRLKDVYQPITARRTEDLSAIWTRPVSELLNAEVDSARLWTEKRLESQLEICTTSRFAESIDPMYADIRSRLGRL